MKFIILFFLILSKTFITAQDTIPQSSVPHTFIDGKYFFTYNNKPFTGISVNKYIPSKNHQYANFKTKNSKGLDTLIKFPTDSIVTYTNYKEGLVYGEFFVYDLYWNILRTKGFNESDFTKSYVYNYFPMTGKLQSKKISKRNVIRKKTYNGQGELIEKEVIKPKLTKRMKKEFMNKDQDDELEMYQINRTKVKRVEKVDINPYRN
ncbi:MAG: hypothetical protein V4622_10185 [Bacteroidota bacterium]